MSTWTYDITTTIGQVRLLIGDKDIVPTTDATFTDEEIQAFLTLNDDDTYLAAAMALEAWTATLTSSVTSESIRSGDYSYTKKEVDNKLALAARYRSSSATVPCFEIGSMDLTNGSGITEEED